MNKISDLFFNQGCLLNFKIENIKKVNFLKIKEIFKSKGIIIFRNINLDKNNLINFTDNFSYTYANDATRRSKRFGSDFIRNVDSGNQKIDLHSEASFSPSCPEIIWFYCVKPAKKSGKTLLCDGVSLWNSLNLETKNFFLSNQISYKLKIPYLEKKLNKSRKKWYLPYEGISNCFVNFKTGEIEIDYNKYAVHKTIMPTRNLAFANHLFISLKSEPQLIQRTLKNKKRIPEKFLKEINFKAEKNTLRIMLKKNDLVMIDNHRFMHGREKILNKEKRDIINVQTLSSNI